MELAPNSYGCDWCGTSFTRRHATGRRPLYCRRTCRQRAYEHRRRAALPPDGPRVPGPAPRQPAAYVSGSKLFGRRHALRPVGAPSRTGERPTLCGTTAHANHSPFWPTHPDACRTCVRISARYPAPWPADPSNELAALRAHYAVARASIVRLDRAIGSDDVPELARTARDALAGIVGPPWPPPD